MDQPKFEADVYWPRIYNTKTFDHTHTLANLRKMKT